MPSKSLVLVKGFPPALLMPLLPLVVSTLLYPNLLDRKGIKVMDLFQLLKGTLNVLP
jgi:hypothetical protein